MTTYCSVHVTLTVAPEKVDEFLETAKPLFETVSAEPHCLSYAVFKSKDNPGEVQLVETYDKSLDWLTENQVTKPYYAEHFPKLEPYMVKDRVMKAYDIVPPVQWAKKSAQGRA